MQPTLKFGLMIHPCLWYFKFLVWISISMLSVLRLASPSQAQVSSMVFSAEKAASEIPSSQGSELIAPAFGYQLDIEDMGIEKSWELSSNSAVTAEEVQASSRTNAHLLELAIPMFFWQTSLI